MSVSRWDLVWSVPAWLTLIIQMCFTAGLGVFILHTTWFQGASFLKKNTLLGACVWTAITNPIHTHTHHAKFLHQHKDCFKQKLCMAWKISPWCAFQDHDSWQVSTLVPTCGYLLPQLTRNFTETCGALWLSLRSVLLEEFYIYEDKSAYAGADIFAN